MKSPRFVAVAMLAAGALALSACGGAGDSPGEDGTQAGGQDGGGRGELLRLGVLGEPLSWDPAQAHVGHTLQPYQAVYDTLLLREPEGELAPMLATEWGYTDDSNLVLALELRDDVTFTDGEAFNADAVVANIEHFQSANGRQAAQAAAIESVSATGDYSVEIVLNEPDAAMEYYLSQALGLMGSPAAIGTEDIAQDPVGSGPYVMVGEESVVGGQYTFDANDDYWNADLQKWDRIVMNVLTDPTARVNALTSGEVDVTLLDGTTMGQAESAGLELLEYGVDWGGLLLLDRDGDLNPALGDVRVRQAINYAFDKEALLQEIYLGNGELTSQVFGPNSTAFLPELDDYYTYDPDRARELLEEAGYGDGFELELPVLTPGTETINTFVAQQLGDVGITVQQTAVPGIDYQGELGAGKFAAAWFNLFQGPSWVAVSQIILPIALYNPFESTTPEVEAWVEEIRVGGEEGDAAAQELNRYLVENAWFAPWYRQSQLLFYNPDVVTPTVQIEMAVPSIYNFEPVG